jgi:hypothetical protein
MLCTPCGWWRGFGNIRSSGFDLRTWRLMSVGKSIKVYFNCGRFTPAEIQYSPALILERSIPWD